MVSQAIQENSDANGDIKDEDIIAASAGVLYAGKPNDITNKNSLNDDGLAGQDTVCNLQLTRRRIIHT